ncbi:MAG: hypothetical protein QM820_12835 [Minicystis sp.]
MRVNLGFLGFVLVAGSAAVGFTACGSSVAEVTGGTGGAGGQGGAPTTNVTVSASSSSGLPTTAVTSSSSSSSSSSTSTSSSSGGNPKCVQGCMHLEQCNFGVTCQQFMIDCNNVGNQYDCLLDCLNDTPCDKLGFQTVQACNQMCQGMTTSSSSSSSSGGNPMQCQGCAFQQCQQQTFACGSNQQCMAWLGCINGCNQAMPIDPQCGFDCDTQYAAAKPLYDPLYACTCSKCSTECGSGDPCAHVPDGGP